jgi:hypothetical protein
LRYGGIVQSAENFADLSQRFISRLPDHPHGYIPGVQARFAARNQTLSIHLVFFGYSLQSEPNAVSNAVDYAKFRSRSHDAPVSI